MSQVQPGQQFLGKLEKMALAYTLKKVREAHSTKTDDFLEKFQKG